MGSSGKSSGPLLATPKRTIATFGDSITALTNQTDPSAAVATSSNNDPRNYMTWALAYLQQRFKFVAMKGVGGNTTTQMLARTSDILGLTTLPGWCVVQGGTNDVSGTVAAATIVSNLQAICTQFLAAGINVVLTTIPPNSGASSTAQKLIRATANRQIREYAQTTAGVVLADIYAGVVDPTASNYRSTYSPDGIHPSALGAQNMGHIIYTALNGLVPPNPLLASANEDTENTLAHGVFDGDQGNGLATGWTSRFSTRATFSKVARTDDFGNSWQQIVANSAADDIYQYTSGLVANDVVVATVEFEADNDWVACTNLGLDLNFQGTSDVHAYAAEKGANAASALLSPNGRFVLRTLPAKVPATGFTGAALFIRWAATSGTLRVGRASVIKVA